MKRASYFQMQNFTLISFLRKRNRIGSRRKIKKNLYMKLKCRMSRHSSAAHTSKSIIGSPQTSSAVRASDLYTYYKPRRPHAMRAIYKRYRIRCVPGCSAPNGTYGATTTSTIACSEKITGCGSSPLHSRS